MNKLLKEVVAEAKAVRETALANAKIALEEAFAPKLQSMISHKIKEEMEEDEMTEMDYEEGEMEMNTEGEGGEPEVEVDIEMEPETEEMPAEEEAPAEEEMPEEEEEMEMSDEELEEILRELDGDEDEMTEMESEDEDPMEGNYSEEEDPMEGMSSKEKMKKGLYKEEDHSDEEDIDLEEIIKALREEEGEEKEMEEEESTEDELEEAYEVIKFLRSKLNEVNLLNAKLLFVNKLFKKAELSESKKIKIIETFDRVKNVREAKLVYASLAENISSTPVKRKVTKKRNVSITEGLASAPTRGTKKPIVENNTYNRFTELINYNK